MPLLTVIERMTLGPAKILGLPYGRLAKGAPGDVVVVDPEARWTPTAAALASKSKNSPFLGKEMRGRAVATVLAGRVVHGAV